MALTQLGDVSTIAQTLVETLNHVLQNLDATGSVDSSVVHAGRAQTLAKFFYDRNDHGRGSMFGWTWRSQIACLDGKNRFHVWMDLTLLAHLCQALVPLVDSDSKGGGFVGTASTTNSSKLCGQKKRKKVDSKFVLQKFLNLSRAIKYGKPDMRPVPVLSDYLVKLVIPASRAI